MRCLCKISPNERFFHAPPGRLASLPKESGVLKDAYFLKTSNDRPHSGENLRGVGVVKNLRKLCSRLAFEIQEPRRRKSYKFSAATFPHSSNANSSRITLALLNRAKLSLNSQPSIIRACVRATAARYITHPRDYGVHSLESLISTRELQVSRNSISLLFP